MECRKCPYFEKKRKNKLLGGKVIMGFCKLRERHISDETITAEFCKDRAILTLSENDTPHDFIEKIVNEEEGNKERALSENRERSGAEQDGQSVFLSQKPKLKKQLSEEEEKLIKKAAWGS